MKKILSLGGDFLRNATDRRVVALTVAGILLAGCTDGGDPNRGDDRTAPPTPRPAVSCATEAPVPEKKGGPTPMLAYGFGPEDLPKFLSGRAEAWNDFVDAANKQADQQHEAIVGVSARMGYDGEDAKGTAQEQAQRIANLASEHLDVPMIEESGTYPAQAGNGTIYVYRDGVANQISPDRTCQV